MCLDWRIRRRQLHFTQEYFEAMVEGMTVEAGDMHEVRSFPVMKVHAVNWEHNETRLCRLKIAADAFICFWNSCG